MIIKSFKKFVIYNYNKMKLAMGLLLGLTAIIFLIFYIIGVLNNNWEYNPVQGILGPILASILTGVPLFGLIIVITFCNYYKTRLLFYKIIKYNRHELRFFLKKEFVNDPKNELRYSLWCNYKDFSFRFAYSLGHPLIVSLLMDMRNYDIMLLNRQLRKYNLKGRCFNGYGLSLNIKRAFAPKYFERISDKLDLLIGDIHKITK